MTAKQWRHALAALCLVHTGAWAAEVEYRNSGGVIDAELPFSEAVRVDDTLYLAGQLGVKPGTLELAPGGIEGEARQAMENIRAVLARNDLTLDDLVKCTAMLADISEWERFNAVYRTFFDKHYPARSAFGTSGLGLGGRVEIECIAAYGDSQ